MRHRALDRIAFAAAGALLTACASIVLAQTPAAAQVISGGTVFDVKGDVMILSGARTTAATRGVAVQPGDRVFMQPDAILLIRCPASDVMRVTTPGTFTFSGCQPAAAAVAATPVAPTPAATPAAMPTTPPATSPGAPIVVARSGGMGGGTLGVIGGLVLLGAAAGGGGGGGSSGSSSSSPPVSP